MRKFVAMLLVLALCACMLVACGKQEDDGGNGTGTTAAVTDGTTSTKEEPTEAPTEAPQTPKQDWTNFY